VESGTWSALIRTPHSRFRALCDAQGVDAGTLVTTGHDITAS
jgi:hypothetical protein